MGCLVWPGLICWREFRGHISTGCELWDRLSLVAIVNRRVRPCTENLSSSSWQRLPPLLCTPLLPLPRASRTATAYKGGSGVIQAIVSFPTINNAWPPRAARMPIAGSIPCTPTVSNGADIGGITDLERATTRPADVSQRVDGRGPVVRLDRFWSMRFDASTNASSNVMGRRRTALAGLLVLVERIAMLGV